MKIKTRFWLLIILATSVIFSGIWTIQRIIFFENYATEIIKALETITNRPIRLQNVEWSPTSGLFTLNLINLEIGALDPAEPPLLKVKQTLIGMSPTALLDKKLNITSLTFIEPQINLIQRQGTKLLKRATETAQLSDHKMIQNWGSGLTTLTIDNVTIQDGILTILDWEDEAGQTFIFDRLEARIHHLSPDNVSPVTASARFQSIPFTINGQVGPLPDSLELNALPILLTLEAKSLGVEQLADTFPKLPLKFTAARGYFSIILHGSYDTGLQTNFWLEFNQLVLHKLVNSTETSEFETFKPMDLSLRNKMVLRRRPLNGPLLEIQEMFLYLDGSPLLDIKGKLDWKDPLAMQVQLTTLAPIPLDRLPMPSGWLLAGQSLEGRGQVDGEWPQKMELHMNLDLTNVQLNWSVADEKYTPLLQKAVGIPLRVESAFNLNLEDLTLFVRQATLSRIENDKQKITLTGSIWPTTILKVQGDWDLAYLADYFPTTTPWHLQGFTHLDLRIEDRPERFICGSFSSAQTMLLNVPLKDLKFDFTLTDRQLNLPHIEATLGTGQLEASLLVDMNHSEPDFQALFTLQDTPIDWWYTLSPPEKEDLTLEGVLSGQGSVQGFLNQKFMPDEKYILRANLEISAAKIVGLDARAILQPSPPSPPDLNLILSEPKKTWTIRPTATDLVIQNGIYYYTNLAIDVEESGWNLTGQGTKNKEGEYDFEFIQKSIDGLTEPQTLHLQGKLNKWEIILPAVEK
ncbi:MAG: hypothetical protein H7832_10085 [Magnetococcus sp. DMHC-6]